MIMTLATVTFVSALAYNGGNVSTSSAVFQLTNGGFSRGIGTNGDQQYPASTLAATYPPTGGLRAELGAQVESHLYKVRDDHATSDKGTGLVQVSKAGGKEEPLAQLHQQLLSKEKEIVILRGKTDAATDLLNFEKHRTGVLETQVAQLKQELKALHSRGQANDQLSRELVITRSSLDQAKQKIVDLDRQLATSNLEHAKRRISELDRQLDNKDKEIIALRTNVEDKDKLKGNLASRTEELKQSKQHIVALEQELTLAKETIDKVTRRLTDLDSQLTTRNAQLEQAKQLLANLRPSERRKQEVPLSHELTVADKKQSRPASRESGQHIAKRDRPNLARSDESELSGGDLAKLNHDLSNELRSELVGGGVLLRQAGNKLSLELATGEMFAPGRAVVTQHGNSLLQRIGAVLQKFRYQTIEVAGHTDDEPIGNDLRKTFQDNGKLSRARAEQASRALISGGLQADRVQAVGYAATKPIATNATEEGRSKNRRVDVIITQWSEPDDSSGDTTTRVSKNQPMFSIQNVAHR